MTRLAGAFLLLALPALAGDPPPSDADAKAAIDAIAEAVKGGDAAAIKDAITRAGDCPHGKVIKALQDMILTDHPEDWRTAAAKALGRMKGSADAAAALNATLEKVAGRKPVFSAVCDAIQEAGQRSSIAALTSFARARVSRHDKEDLENLGAAIDALSSIQAKASVEAVLDLWQKCKYSGRDPQSNFKDKVAGFCHKAMRRLTGEKQENFREWEDWWKDTRDKLNDDLSKK